MSRDYVEKLLECKNAKVDRAEAIRRRFEELERQDKLIMTVAELESTREEVRELHAEIQEINKWLESAKHELAEWFAPAMVIQ